MQFLLENSGIPKNLQKSIALGCDDCDYETFMYLAEIKDDIQEIVERGGNIYICSEMMGNGKTSWAVKLLLKYFDEVWAGNGFVVKGLFIHVPSFLTALKNFENPTNFYTKHKEDILNCDLIVWDDIASTGLSNFDLTNLTTYIDQRILAGKANIYTGNFIDFESVKKSIGDRLASRVYRGSEVITLYGRDRRNGGELR